MVKRTVNIRDISPLLLFGVNDKHIQRLIEVSGVRIAARGNQVNIEGDKAAVERVEHTLEDMMITIERKGSLTVGDVEALLNAAEHISIKSAGVANGRVPILTTHRGVVSANTPGQKKYYHATQECDIVFAVGPAGTGKTYQAVAVAVAALKSRQIERIIITRPAVEAGERLGFLPGDLKDKIDPYLTPLYDALQDMLPNDKMRSLMEQRVIEIAPLAYMRGRTLNSAYVILDEAQNATTIQMKMFLTRLGINSRAIITGDITQSDLEPREESGLVQAMDILDGIDGIAICRLTREDVVRHRLVKEILKAYESIDAGTAR